MSTLRRIPRQERSRRRVLTILEAAAELFETVGFTASTMEAIAARAGTSVGSLYQYFPDKRSIFGALAEHCLEDSRETFQALLGADPTAQPLCDVIDTLIDGFAARLEQSAPLRALFRNIKLYAEYAEADRALVREFISAATTLLASKAPQMPPTQQTIVATTVVQAAVGLFHAMAGEAPETAAAVRAETKRMLRRYLEPYVEANGHLTKALPGRS